MNDRLKFYFLAALLCCVALLSSAPATSAVLYWDGCKPSGGVSQGGVQGDGTWTAWSGYPDGWSASTTLSTVRNSTAPHNVTEAAYNTTAGQAAYAEIEFSLTAAGYWAIDATQGSASLGVGNVSVSSLGGWTGLPATTSIFSTANAWNTMGTYKSTTTTPKFRFGENSATTNRWYLDQIRLTSATPTAPTLSSPANGATGVPFAGTTLTWANGTYNYLLDVYLGTTASPTTLLASNLAEGTTSRATGTLLPNTTYYWKVVAKNVDNTVQSTTIRSFTTADDRVTVFEEGFNGAITGWTMDGGTGYDYSTLVNHGTFPGPGGAYMDLVAYNPAGGGGSQDRMFRKYYRVDNQNGEAGPYTGESYPTPFGEGIVSGYFYDFEDSHKEYAGGHSCSRLRQALSLRGMNAGFVLDNGIYYGSPVANPIPAEEFSSQRCYSYRMWGVTGGTGDRAQDWQSWNTSALRWDHNSAETYPDPDCTGTIGWVWFQTQLVPDAPSAHSSQTDPQAKFNFWRKEETKSTATQTLSNQNVTLSYWKYGFERVTLGTGGYSEDSAGMWDDISLKAYRPGDPVIAPAQAGPQLAGYDPKTSITWYWTNLNVGNNIFAYDLADPEGINKAPVYPMGQPGDGLLDGESDEWIQRWQTQYTEVGLTPNAPYRRKVHAWNGTLNSNYTDVSFQTRLLDGTIVGNGAGPFPDVSTYPWAQAEVDPTGAGASGNLYFWDGYTHPEEHLAIDGVAVAPDTAHGHGPSNTWWHKHVTGHIPFAFENSAIFGTSTHGGSVWKASRFKYIWNMSATPPAWNSSTPATEWSSGTINLACTDTFLPGGAPVDGAYYLHVAAMNENGEWNYTAADTATYGPFQYDHTVPLNPAIGCDDGFGQGEVHADPSPSFTLSGASDPGTVGVTASGLEVTSSERYRYYWGPEPLPTGAGAPVTLSGETITGLTVPLNSTGTYYLHVQTKDEAGNWSDPVTWTYNFKTPEWEFPTGAVNLAPPGVYNWDVWTDPLGKHDSMVYASSNSKAHGVWGTADLVPGTPAPKLKDAVQAEDIWLEADPSGALDLNGPVYGRLPVARLMVGATPTATRTVIGGTCAPDTAQSGRVYAIEAGTRQVLWTHDIGAGYNVKAKPGGAFNKTIGTYTGDVIYAVTDKQGANNYLRALKATDGTKLWSTDELGLTGVGPILGAPFLMPVGAQEAVYFATMDDGAQPGGVYAVNLATGSLLNGNWPKQLGSFKSALGTDGSFVYGVNEAGHLWKISLDGSSATDIATLDVGANQGIYGAPCWVYPRWVAGGNWLIISSNAGKVYCIDVANPGTPKWVVDIPAPSCPIYWNGSVYVGSSNKKLYQLDVDDGSVVTSRNLPATVGDPVIDQVWNRLYLHAGDGVMYGFNLPL